MDDDERRKKLLAGKERLAKFQKQKTSPEKKAKKKKRKKPTPGQDGQGGANGDSDISTPGPLSDDSSYDQVDSSFASDFSSPLHSEADQLSIASESIDEDSDSHYDGGISSPIHDASSDRIIELEETLEGKELALRMMQEELEISAKALAESRARSDELEARVVQQVRDEAGGAGADQAAGETSPAAASLGQGGDSASMKESFTSDREEEYKTAIQQYNLKIMEFQNALAQRDDIIKQLSDNLQGALQSRDEVQHEATNQAEQLRDNIQALQSQLRTAGETLQNQGQTQVAELAEELNQAHSQVVNLRQTVVDKDAIMHELANRYSKKSEELFELKEVKENLIRQHSGEMATLKQEVAELKGEDSSPRRDELIEVLRAELDESYGNQMMLMKQQLLESHQQDLELMQQRCNELQVLARTNAGASDTEIEALHKQLAEKDRAVAVKDKENVILREQLEKLVAEFSRQNDEIEQKHVSEMEMVKDMIEQEMKIRLDEMENEKDQERERHKEALADLAEKAEQALSENKNLEEVRDTYEGQITRLMKQLEESQLGGDNTELLQELEQERKRQEQEIVALKEQLEKSLEDNKNFTQEKGLIEDQIEQLKSELEGSSKRYADEILELKGQLDRSAEENRELTQIREAYEGQIGRLSAEVEGKNKLCEELESLQNEKDVQLAESENKTMAVEKELEELKMTGPSMEKLEEIREDVTTRVKRDYDDLIDDLKYNQEAELKKLKVQMDVEYTDKLKDATKAVEDQVEQRVKKVQTEKEREFVAELQNVRAELSKQYEDELQKVTDDLKKQHEEELESVLEEQKSEKAQVLDEADKEDGSQGGGVLAQLKGDLATKLQAEVQDLSEVRDTLLEQLENANRHVESLRGELAAASFGKDSAAAEAARLNEELQGIHFQTDMTVDSPFYDNERDDLNEKLQVLNSKLQSQEQDHEIEVSGYVAKLNALRQELAESKLAHDQEKEELDGKMQDIEAQLQDKQNTLASEDSKDDSPSALEEEMKTLGESNAHLVSELDQMQVELANAKGYVEEHVKRTKDLETKNRILEDEAEQLKKQLEYSGHEMDGLQEAMSSLKDVQRNEMDQISSENTRLESELEEMQERMKSQSEDNDDVHAVRKELEENLAKVEDERSLLEKEVEKAELEIDRLQKEVEQAEEKMHDLEGEVSRQAAERNDVEEKDDELKTELEKRLAQVEEEKSNLEKEVEKARLEAEHLKVEVEQAEDKMHDLEGEVSRQAAERNDVEEKDDELKTELEERLAQVEEEKSNLEKEVEKARLEVEHLKVEVEQAEEKMHDLEGEVSRQAAERNDVEEKDNELKTELEGRLAQVEEENRSIVAVLDKTRIDIELLQREVELAEEKIHDLEGEVSRQAGERNDLEEKMANVTSERDQLLSEKEKLQHQLESEQKDHDSVIGELEARVESFSGTGASQHDDEIDKIRDERDSALGTLESLSSQHQGLDAKTKELELEVANLEEQLQRQQSVELVKDVEIMAQKEAFETAVADYDRLIDELKSDKEELKMELERVSQKDEVVPSPKAVEEDVVVAENVAPVAAAAPGGDAEETLNSENENLKSQLSTATDDIESMRHREHQLEKEVSALKSVLQEGEEEKAALEDMIQDTQSQVDDLKLIADDFERENEQLKETLEQQADDGGNQGESVASLQEDIARLQTQLGENQEVLERENRLLQEALQEERDTTSRLLNEGESPTSRDTLLQEIIDLKQRLAHKDQTEHEILTEKNLQIGVLQESKAKLEQERENLHAKISDLEKRMQASEAISLEVQDTFGRQFMELQTEQASLKEELEKQKTDPDASRGQSLDEQALREEALRCAKDMLLQKLEEKDAVEQKMLDEKMELQKRLAEQQRLEELLNEKDRLEQELGRQKRALQAEVKDLEQKLQDQRRKLQNEKLGLESELQQKDFELRKWEANFREQQLEYRNRDAFVKRKHTNELDSLRSDSEKEAVARLEGMRLILERQHAEAVSRLKRDLETEFSSREMGQEEKHLSDLSLLKARHHSQLEELTSEFEARIGSLKEELEEERKKQVGAVKSVHERLMEQDQAEHLQTLQDLKDQHEWEMEALKGELDTRQQEIFDEMKAKMEEAHQKEKEAVRQQCESKAQQELESVKSTMEQVYVGQTEAVRAELAHDKIQALNEQRQALVLAQEQAHRELEESWQARLEEERREVVQKTDEAVCNSEELITQLQRRLSLEHKQVVQSLAEQWDQEAVDRLEGVRAEMEAKYSQEMEKEKQEAEEQREEDVDRIKQRLEEDHKEDVELLLKEREMLVEHAEEMRQNLDKVHHKELAELRANLKAEYDQYVRAREELEISRSQSEASLIDELAMLRIAHQDLQQQYRADVSSLKVQLEQAGVTDPDQLAKENQELQTALTTLRAKLQEEHAEELNQLRIYFEKQVEDNDENWKHEMAQLKGLYESPRDGARKDSDEKEAKRSDYSHAMMTLTHFSDSDSSPPRSPPKFLEVEAELKQELRGQLEHEYQKSIKHLRQELESDHEAAMARVKMEYDLQREEDMLQLEDRLNAKHTQDANDIELDYLNQFEELRNQLEGDHSKEIARLRLEAAGDLAKAVDEAVNQLKADHEEAITSLRTELEENHAKENQDIRLQMSSELASAVADEMERLRETLQEEHMEEMEHMRKQLTEQYDGRIESEKLAKEAEEVEKLKEEWEIERDLIIKASRAEVVDEVAKVVTDATIERALLQVEIDTQHNILGVCLEELNSLKASAEVAKEEQQESLQREIERLKKELEAGEENLRQFCEAVKSGEAPEVQELKEALMRDYDNRLEMITSTMNDEMDGLVRTTQQQARTDLEKMQEDFASQHQALMDRFVEDQEKALGELKVEHEQDLAREKEQLEEELQAKHEQALSDLRHSLDESKELELEELRRSHAGDLEQLKLDMMKLTDEERSKVEEKMMEERRGAEEMERRIKELEENHRKEKEDLREELVASHMEKFRKMTAELEESHKQELEASTSSLQTDLETSFSQKLSSIETELQDSSQQHEDEITNLKRSFELKQAQLESDHHDQLAAVGASQEGEVETAKGELEEAHRKEVIDLQNRLEAQKQKEIEELQIAFGEAKKMLVDNQNAALKRMDDEQKEREEEMDRKREEELNALREEMNRNAEQEKGEMDQKVQELEDKLKEEKETLATEMEKLKAENAALLEKVSERESVIGRTEREHEEGSTLLAMLRQDLDRLGTERDTLQQTNNHLLRVLTQVVHTTMSTENAINRRMGAGSRPLPRPQGMEVDRRGDGRPSSPRMAHFRGAVGGDTSSDGEALHDTSVTSIFSDEGLELSQHINESMFVGPDLDSEGEELITGATTRLHSAVEHLLDRYSDSSSTSDGRRPVEAEGYASSRSSREEEEEGDHEDLVRRLQAEVREKERLALELHKSDGLLEGINSEKLDMQEALERAQERQHEMVVQIERLSEQLTQMAQANQALQDGQDQFEQQRAVLAERLGLEDLGLIEENADLRQQLQALQQEQQDLERQASMSKGYLEQQVQAMEAQTEEQISAAKSREEEARLRAEDLQRQVEAAKKMQSSHKQFLAQQSVDWEQEREEFQREIVRLEEEVKQKDKPGGKDPEQLEKEIQDLKEEISQHQEAAAGSESRIQLLERDVAWKQDTVNELAKQIKELERQLDDNKKLPAKLSELEAELRGQRHVEEEMRHEKEALQKQCYDQLLQISALQSKLDAHKHGLDSQVKLSPTSKALDDTANEGPMSLAQQWEQDKEALERKDKEIEDLVEQLEQFREDLTNKDEEIGQLQLQLEVASREQGSGRENMQEEISQVKAENERLKDELQSPSRQVDQEHSSLSQLAQDLLDEKNLEIDQLTQQVQDLAYTLEEDSRRESSRELVVEEVITINRRSGEGALSSPTAEERTDELDQLRVELESQIADKDQEISRLRQQLGDREKQEEEDEEEGDVLSKPAVVELLDKMQQRSQDDQETKKQLEQEVSSMRQILTIREREVTQLETQLVRTQEQALSRGGEGEANEALQKNIQEKELEIMDLRLQIDRLEEAVFQAQQDREEQEGAETSTTRATPPTVVAMETERTTRVQAETIRRLEGELDQERSRGSEMEADYQRRVASVQGLSPGKTLEQKLNEIRKELTQQHQQHVADIQRTMQKEAELRIEQIRTEHTHQLRILEERHHTKVQEAVLRTNRDLLTAHGEEKARVEEEHRRQMERVAAAASPFNLSSADDAAHLLHKEVENTARLDSNLLGHLRRRQGGVGREQSPGEGAMTNGGEAPELDMNNGEIPPRLQGVLARLHSEGLQVLSLSDLRYLRQATSPRPVRRGTDIATLQNAWQNEKQALLDAMQALKDLITHTTAGLTNDESDWRGDLLRAIQSVFEQERESLLSELRTHVVASGDQDLSQVQLLERRIREQESHHKAAMEQIYGADRASLLAEVHDLRLSNNTSRIELQEVRQKSTQQLSALEEQSSNREKQLKRQAETMEHKFRQERILADDLRTSLTVERQKLAQLGASLTNEKKQVSDLRDDVAELQALVDRLHTQKDDLECRMSDVAAAFEAEKMRSASVVDMLESERRNVAKLHEALSTEAERSAQARDREQRLAKELRKELEAERRKSAETSKSLESVRSHSESLSRELEAERTQKETTVSTEKMKLTDLKRALDVEKARCQEAHTALQREQTLNAQLHENTEQERRAFAEDSLRDKSTVSDLQNLLEGERRKAVELHSTIQRLESQIGRLEGALHSQRSQGSDIVDREKAVSKKLKESLENLDAQCRDLNERLGASQEALSNTQAERDQLKTTLGGHQERELDREAQWETERESERLRIKEREKEREVEKQRQRDRELERQLDKQKLDSLEDELTDVKRTVKRLEREKQRLRESQSGSDNIHRSIEIELGSESLSSPQRRREGAVSKTERATLDLYKGQLESVRQRLQLMAVKQQEELSKIERATVGADSVSSSTVHELRSVDGALIELITELRQIHAALTLLSESQPPLVTSTAARINERLLDQNAEMSSYVSQLSSEKSELRGALSRLEEEIWQYRQREGQRHQSPHGSSSDRDLESLLARERAKWAQECLETQQSLQEAERQIAQLKLDLERGSLRRETGALNGDSTEQQQQQKIQRLYGRYLRAESFRKALVYQKKYLLLLLGGFQDCEQATLSLIAKMGAYPSPEDLRDTPTRHSKAFSRFRSAARVVIAVSRLKFLVRKWKRATRAGSREIMGGATTTTTTPPTSSQTDAYPHQRTTPSHQSPLLQQTHASMSPAAAPGLSPASGLDGVSRRYTSPHRTSPRVGEYAGDSPPVRDRASYGMVNGMAHSGAHSAGRRRPFNPPHPQRHGATSLPHLASTPESRQGDAYGDRLGAGSSLNESDGSFYIRKLETLQEKLGAMQARKTTLGREQASSSRYSYTYSKR